MALAQPAPGFYLLPAPNGTDATAAGMSRCGRYVTIDTGYSPDGVRGYLVRDGVHFTPLVIRAPYRADTSGGVSNGGRVVAAYRNWFERGVPLAAGRWVDGVYEEVSLPPAGGLEAVTGARGKH